MSGWTVLTIDVEDDELASVIDKNLRIKYEGKDPPTATGYGDRTVQLDRGTKHYRAAQRFAEEYPGADRILVISANDTTDSGNGTLYEIEADSDDVSINKVDSKSGYEGAHGNDVVGYFRDEYDVRGYSEWEA